MKISRYLDIKMVYELTSKISKCRNELMGIAILEVMLWHLQESAGVRNQLLQVFTKLIYTPGFFFLSGFGLFYSLSGNSNILSFYRKRIFRLYLPYLIISTPFILYIGILKGKIIVDLLMDISTLNFWIRGNYLGVWYIAVSLVLYFIAPILYRIMFRIQDKSYLLAWLTVLGFAFFSLYSIRFASYITGWTSRAYLFPFGMLVAAFSKEKRPITIVDGMFFSLYFIFGFIYARSYWISIVSIFVFAIILGDKLKTIKKILSWLGKYSLEIFLLHIMIAYSVKFTFDSDLFYAYIVSDVISILLCKYVSNGISTILK